LNFKNYTTKKPDLPKPDQPYFMAQAKQM